MSTLPTIYIPHGGGPCFFMDWKVGPPQTWHKMAAWLESLGSLIDPVPKAVVVVSAHWEENEFTVTTNEKPSLIYDYYNFPAHTYELKYEVPGAPQVASRLAGLLEKAGFGVKLDDKRGLDHGVFIPFKLIYPNADIPIVQLSLKAGLDPGLHIRVGHAISELRNEGVLIVGSGMSYHNLPVFGARKGAAASGEFDRWLTSAVTNSDPRRRNEALSFWSDAPSARAAHPREEHLIPLMVTAGAAKQDLGKQIFSDNVMEATVSAYQFG